MCDAVMGEISAFSLHARAIARALLTDDPSPPTPPPPPPLREKVTASHLPEEKNGMKFLAARGGLMKDEVNDLISLAQNEARGARMVRYGDTPAIVGEFGRPLFQAREFTPCVECVVVPFI